MDDGQKYGNVLAFLTKLSKNFTGASGPYTCNPMGCCDKICRLKSAVKINGRIVVGTEGGEQTYFIILPEKTYNGSICEVNSLNFPGTHTHNGDYPIKQTPFKLNCFFPNS